ncbi:hypothetical protein [Pseudarthrobacter scleromae]|uniref:Uncharacterized protein n=1 Tax=Pseudarthrobacter scleromae TaxID=158897 RepID=A0ABQ2CDZ3_9MICC|nr:hypothetical protein [Pseudarthrobacter scleromae]GGI81983.1 hypothetical protein GCM10007175_19180 [Pseudarthrobacter scleromae]
MGQSGGTIHGVIAVQRALELYRASMDTFAVLYPQLQDTDFRTTAVSLDVPVFFVQGAHEARGRVEPFRECVWFWLCPA